LEKPGAVIAGPFHPAFRSLVETALFLEMAAALLSSSGRGSGAPALPPADAGGGSILRFTLSPADVSSFYGARRENIKALQERFGPADIRVSPDPALPRRTLMLTVGEKRLRTDCSGKITEIRLQEYGRHGMDHSTGA
jgi:hypothetical protein